MRVVFRVRVEVGVGVRVSSLARTLHLTCYRARVSRRPPQALVRVRVRASVTLTLRARVTLIVTIALP